MNTQFIFDGYENTNNCRSIDISGNFIGDKDRKKIEHEQMPWIEKYRPVNIDDLMLDQNIVKKINKIIIDRDMPNMIILGTPGIGKTSTLKCIANTMYGKHAKNMVLEINASDERGIKSVDDIITVFCKKLSKHDSVKHKLIILDEADNMPVRTQQSINKKITTYNSTTRFAFTCNDSENIIESIQSKCIILKYGKINQQAIVSRLKKICMSENVDYSEDGLNEIAMISQGDMRNAINNLQIINNSYKIINPENVYMICDKPRPLILLKLLTLCCAGKENTKQVFQSLTELKYAGYSYSDIVLGMINVLKSEISNNIKEKNKIIILKHLCHTTFRLSRGINSDLQLFSCMSNIISSFS